MGGLVEGFFTDVGAPDEAARAQIRAIQHAIGTLRRQQGVTREDISPFLRAGQRALPGAEQAATIGGFGQRIGALSEGGALQPLIDERTRAVQGQLSAGGLTRSGTAVQEIAAVPQDILLAIENMLSQRGVDLTGRGQAAGVQLGEFGQTSAGRIANFQRDVGAVEGAGILSEAKARSAQAGQFAEGAGELFELAAGFFSDPRLKENVEEIFRIPVDQHSDEYLRVVQWDWIPETKGTIIENSGNMGFMSDEVKKFFPEFVGNYGGFDVINYSSLLKRLKAING